MCNGCCLLWSTCGRTSHCKKQTRTAVAFQCLTDRHSLQSDNWRTRWSDGIFYSILTVSVRRNGESRAVERGDVSGEHDVKLDRFWRILLRLRRGLDEGARRQDLHQVLHARRYASGWPLLQLVRVRRFAAIEKHSRSPTTSISPVRRTRYIT